MSEFDESEFDDLPQRSSEEQLEELTGFLANHLRSIELALFLILLVEAWKAFH